MNKIKVKVNLVNDYLVNIALQRKGRDLGGKLLDVLLE